jgi:hypothetical protein
MSAGDVSNSNPSQNPDKSDPPAPPQKPSSEAPKWVVVAGVLFGALTLIFFMVLVIYSAPLNNPSTRLPLVIVLALGVALSASFLGGAATVSGRIPLPGNMDPVAFSAAGGIAVFIIVFLLGWIATKDKVPSVTLFGRVTDKATGAGIARSVITIEADGHTFTSETTDSGDFRVEDIPNLFNKHSTVSARATNYISPPTQTALLGLASQGFNFTMSNCYNGVWHETDNYHLWPPGIQGLKWTFQLKAPDQLHIVRADGFMWGDFVKGQDGGWTGAISNSNKQEDPSVILNPPPASCDKIITNKTWSYARDTFE